MKVEVSGDWNRAIEALPLELQDFYCSSRYAELHRGDGAPHVAVVDDGTHRLIVPGLAFPIVEAPSRLYDLQTPNGYGGPLVSPGASAAFIEEAWSAWRAAAAASGIVAGFFRLHPLINNRRWLPSSAKVLLDRKTVYVDLSSGPEAVWTGADSRHRNMVNRGRKAGVRTRWNRPEDWPAFETLYAEAMARLGAPSRLSFDTAYFTALRALDGVDLVATHDDRGLVAANVFLWGPVWGHYHLAARRIDAPNFIMNVLVQAGFERAFERGLSGVHLGGGVSTAADDRLLHFKRSVGGELRNYDVGLVVADDATFGALIDTWARNHHRAPSWLLGYRQPSPA